MGVTAAQLQLIKTEISTDPLARGYSGMTDAQIAASGNAPDRPAPGGLDRMLKYMVENRNRSNSGTDTTVTSLMGRLESLANAVPGADPFGSTHLVDLPMIHAARMFRFVLTSPHLPQIDFVNTEVSAMLDLLGSGPGTARVMKVADVDAIKALSQNQQSRFLEIGAGRPNVQDITDAKALP